MICQIANDLLNQYNPYDDLSEREQSIRKIGLGGLFFSIIGGSNYGAIYKTLHLPLSIVTLTGLSFLTLSISVYYKTL